MLELYNFAQSTCSLKVRICLAEKNIPWTDRRLVSRDNDHLSDWYLKLNPNGVVPTLVHDGVPIVESSVIIQYLDDAFPGLPLSPPDHLGRARMRAWLSFVDLVPTPAIRYPSFQYGGLLRKHRNLTPDEFAESVKRRPVKAWFYERMGQSGFPPEDMARAFEDVRKTALRMEAMLAEGGPWLMGEQYGLADIAVAPLIDRMQDLGFAALWEERPLVSDWLARIQDRPAFRTAYYHGSRLSELHPDLGLGRSVRRSPETGEPLVSAA